MIFEDEDLNREVQNIMRKRSDLSLVDPDQQQDVSRLQVFIKNMASADSPESAAEASGIPMSEIDSYLSDPVIHAYIAMERQRIDISEKLLSIDGISRVIAEIIQVSRAMMPDPGLALAYDPGQVPAAAYVYNPGMALKAIEVMVKIKELERRGVVFEDSSSGATSRAQQELAKAIHEAD